MNKEFCITKEFFGGIIENINTKENMYIDSELFNLLQNMLYGKEDWQDMNLPKEEVVLLINEMINVGLIQTNYKFHVNNVECEDYLSHPFRVFYDITYCCNLKCRHCFTNSGEKNKNEMNFEQKRRLIKQCKDLNVGRISIAGGEPFCDNNIIEFLKLCKENQLEVSITTNGTLLDQNTVKRVDDLGIKTLTVSLDGGTEKSNDFIRGKNSFKRTLEGLDNLKKFYNHNYCIKTTLMKTNMDDIDELIKIAIEKKCWSIKFNCVREDGRARENAKDIVLNQEEYIKVIKNIEKIRKKYKDIIDIKAPLNVFCEDDYDYIEELGFGCFAGKESICIDPLGNVKPCSHFPKEFICGNILNEELTDIWHNSSILKKFRNLKGNIKCNECSEYQKCRGGCRYRAFLNEDINGVDPYCYLEENLYHEK